MLVLVLALVLGLSSVAVAQGDLEQARNDVETRLGVSLSSEPPLVVTAASDAEFVKRHEELTGTAPADWVLAVAIPSKNTLLLRGNRLRDGTNFLAPTLRHELGHLVLARVARENGHTFPRWFEEGVCEHAASIAISREDELALGGAARFGKLESLDELAASFPPHAREVQRAYLESRAFVAFLDERAKPEGIAGILKLLRRRDGFDEAITRATGMAPREAEAEWRRELVAKHSVGEALWRSPELWGSLVGVMAFVAAVVWFVRSRSRTPRR